MAFIIIRPRLGQEKCRAKEKALRLRALADLAEDPGTVPTIHMEEALHCLKLQFQGIQSFLASTGTRHVNDTYTHMWANLQTIKTNTVSFFKNPEAKYDTEQFQDPGGRGRILYQDQTAHPPVH